MQQHFVEFLSPGTFVSEVTTKPIGAWSTDEAIKLLDGVVERHGATPYGFRFITRAREDHELDSKVTSRSGIHYLGGTIRTLAEVE